MKLGQITPIVFGKPTILSLEPGVQQFVIANNLWPAVEAFSKVDAELREKGFDQQGQMIIEVDEEDPSWNTLVIEFKVRSIPYAKLLTAWENLTEKYYAPLDEQVKEKVRLILEPA